MIAADSVALALAWLPDLLARARLGGWPPGLRVAEVGIVAVTTMLSIGYAAAQRLYFARVCSTKAIEFQRIFRVAIVSSLVGAILIWLMGYRPSVTGTVIRGAAAFALLVIGRSLFRGWLSAQRRRGRHARPVVIVGTNEDAASWCRLLAQHPELGLEVCAVVGNERPSHANCVDLWQGGLGELHAVMSRTGATGAMVAATDLSPAELNWVVRELMCAGIHVHVSNGIRGIARDRLSPTSIARESLFYVEPRMLMDWQLRTKRALDLVLAAMLLVVLVPLLTCCAGLIKLVDGGPVLFKQKRVGRHGKLFVLLKLRTMVVDAEARQAELASRNRRKGPLFKLDRDPRVTRLGRFLRATSIDELPQLLNVLKGDMSLVGPRPALPSEVATFDEDLLVRHDVPPGITGLWQLEARDNPSFDSYQRLDVHYVENWSLLLDLGIIFSTAGSVVARSVHIFWSSVHGSFSTGRDLSDTILD